MERKGRIDGGAGTQSTGHGANGSAALSDDIGHAVATRLRELGRRIAPTEISDIWVFPPLPHLEGSAEFLLFTRILPHEMRHLCGAEFLEGSGGMGTHIVNGGNGNGDADSAQPAVQATAGNGEANGNGNGTGSDLVRRITMYGAMPTHRVSRVVAGFRDRLGDHREPVHLEIGGCPDSWRRIVDPEVSPTD